MRIWKITIGTEEDGGNVDYVYGVAETAQEAINKAMEWAKAIVGNDPGTGYENPYPAKVEDLGEQSF